MRDGIAEQTGDQMPAERASKGRDRVELSCVRERSKPTSPCDEADAEQVVAPFVEVVPVAEMVPVAVAAPVADVPVVVEKRVVPTTKKSRLEPECLFVATMTAAALFVSWKYPDVLDLYGTNDQLLPLGQRLVWGGGFVGLVGSVLLIRIFDLFLIIGEPIYGLLPSWITKPITNTALGFVEAAKGTARGIGYAFYGIGVGLYYAVTNQLIPSVCVQYRKRLRAYWERTSYTFSSCDSAVLIFGSHILGVAASIVAVCRTDGFPIWDKLIFGWWGFYALNVFYLLGTTGQEKKTTS